jgi:hypothetical protein
LKEIIRKFESEGNCLISKKILRIQQFPRKCTSKYAENPVPFDLDFQPHSGEFDHI